MAAILLDTCAIIYRAGGTPIASAANKAIGDAAASGELMISPISAWEVGLLAGPKRARPSAFQPNPKAWFARVMSEPGVSEATLSWEIAIEASHLPSPLHNDPGDRLLIATARWLAIPIVTRDEKIIAYGRAGHVGVIRC